MSRASRKAKRDVAMNIVVTEHIKKGQTLERVLPLTGYKNTETLSRIKKEVMQQVRNETQTEMQIYREDQLSRIAAKWDEIENDQTMTGAEKHLAWSRWMKLEMDLRGTAAPTRSENLNINADVDPAKLVGYRKFLYHTRHLSEADVYRLVYPYCDSLPASHTPNVLLGEVPDEKS